MRHLPITTGSLIIRRLVPGDAEDFFRLSNEPASRKWLPSQVYRDMAHARSTLEFLIRQSENPGDPRRGPYVLAIEHRADRTLIGHVGFSPIDDDVEIGFSIAEKYQHRGHAIHAVFPATRWALETFSLDRILGIADAANVASHFTLSHGGFSHLEDKVMNFQGTEKAVRVYVLRGPGRRPGT